MIEVVVGLVLVAEPAPLEPIRILDLKQRVDQVSAPGGNANVVRSKLKFGVTSSGCTKPEDFEIKITKNSKGQTLKLLRTRPDPCDAVVHIIEIDIKSNRLDLVEAGHEVFAANPVLAERIPSPR